MKVAATRLQLMVQPSRAALPTALVSALLPVVLGAAWWLSQRRGHGTPEEPCDLSNWGCATAASLTGSLLLVGVPLLFPLVVVFAQQRLIWRSRTVLAVPQMVASLLPAPLILSLVAVTVGAGGDGELAVLVFLSYVPTTVVAALQQAFIRRRLLRQGELRPRSHPSGTPLVHLFFGCYALLLLIGAILTWGPEAKSWQQLVPGVALALLFLILCVGIYAAIALYFVARSATQPTALGKVVRAASIVGGLIALAATGAWGLFTAVFQDSVVERTTIDGTTYLGTKGDYPPVCYHRYEGGPLMKRDCVRAEELRLGAPGAPSPNDAADAPSPGSQSSQPTREPSEPPVSPETVPPEAIVASLGDFGIVQTNASLGQRGTYAFARHSDGSWTVGATVIEDATFTDFVRADGLLLAAFAPDPDFAFMVSIDGGRTWQRADLRSAAIPEDMRYFHDLTHAGGVLTLTTGYPNWVQSDQTDQWTSTDGLKWRPQNP